MKQLDKVTRDHTYDSIAIVGNAPSVFDYRIGEMIDGCDCVIRMNNYKLSEEYEEFIGSKTTVFLTNFYFKDIRKSLNDLRKDNIKMIWSSIPNVDYVNHWKSDLQEGEKVFSGYDIHLPTVTDFLMTNPNSDSINFLKSFLYKIFGKKVFSLKIYQDPIPSTGLMAIKLALKLKPKKLLITGFNFFSEQRTHYFTEKNVNIESTHHKFIGEPYVIEKFIKKNHKIEFVFAINTKIKGIESFRKYSNVRFIESSPK